MYLGCTGAHVDTHMTRDAAASVCPKGGAVPGDVAVVRVGMDTPPQVSLLLVLLVSLSHCVLPVGMYVAVLSYQSLARLVASRTPSHHVLHLFSFVPLTYVQHACVCWVWKPYMWEGGRVANTRSLAGLTHACCAWLPSSPRVVCSGNPSGVGSGCWRLLGPGSPTNTCLYCKYLHVSFYLCRSTCTLWDGVCTARSCWMTLHGLLAGPAAGQLPFAVCCSLQGERSRRVMLPVCRKLHAKLCLAAVPL